MNVQPLTLLRRGAACRRRITFDVLPEKLKTILTVTFLLVFGSAIVNGDEVVGIWLANQAKVGFGSEDMSGRGAEFLKKLKDREGFPVHVRLATWWKHEINQRNSVYSTDRLNLPPYRLLQLHILHIPWGSKSAEGIPMKVSWSSINIATAVEKKAAEQDENTNPDPASGL